MSPEFWLESNMNPEIQNGQHIHPTPTLLVFGGKAACACGSKYFLLLLFFFLKNTVPS